MEVVSEAGDLARIARTCQTLAIAMQRRGELDRAVNYLEHGLEQTAALDDPGLVGELALTLGWMLLSRGDFQLAYPQLLRARELLERGGTDQFRLRSMAALGWHALLQGDFDSARAIFEPLLPVVAATEYRGREAECINALGEIARYTGAHEKARHYYERYRQIEEEMGNITGQICAYINLGSNELEREAFEAAREPLEQTRRLLQRFPIQMYRETLHCCDLALAAGVGDWEACEALLERYSQGFPDAASFGKDHPHHLEQAGKRAIQPRPDLARRLFTLSLDLYAKQDYQPGVKRVQVYLDKLQD